MTLLSCLQKSAFIFTCHVRTLATNMLSFRPEVSCTPCFPFNSLVLDHKKVFANRSCISSVYHCFGLQYPPTKAKVRRAHARQKTVILLVTGPRYWSFIAFGENTCRHLEPKYLCTSWTEIIVDILNRNRLTNKLQICSFIHTVN